MVHNLATKVVMGFVALESIYCQHTVLNDHWSQCALLIYHAWFEELIKKKRHKEFVQICGLFLIFLKTNDIE